VNGVDVRFENADEELIITPATSLETDAPFTVAVT
jgi:hypothetical protein